MHGPQRDTRGTTGGRVKQKALQLGFDACGIASAGEPIDSKRYIQEWIRRGFHADMSWIARTAETRSDPSKKLQNAKSVVVVARNYYFPRPTPETGSGRISRYAWGRDYHNVLRKPLIELARFLDALEPGAKSYASIDTGPVMERAWAARAGVASVGKNSLGLRRDMGSWFFLATVITTVELKADSPATDLCGTCTLCIDACPTGAIVEPYVVDSRRCISYQTIENRGEIPARLHADHGAWVFGCDICQDVCPWNRFARESTEEAFRPRDGHANPDLDLLARMDEPSFNAEFAGSPVRRTKHAGMMRNAAIARKNADAGGD